MTDVLETSLARNRDRLSNCVHCGFCLPACPTYLRLHDEADSPRGRLFLMGAVVEGRLDPASDAFQTHLDRCLGCRACETVCPSGVEYGLLLERAREVARSARRPGLLTRALLWTIRRPPVLALAMGAGRLLRWTGLAAALARLLPTWRGLATARFGLAMLAASAPWRPPRAEAGFEEGILRSGRGGGGEPEQESDRGMWVDHPWQLETAAPEERKRPVRPERWTGPSRGRVALLTGCVQNELFRRVNEATERVLAANGWEVVRVDGQNCCGALHAHAGDLAGASDLAGMNVAAFRASGVDWIVANAAGCGATMREYHELAEGDDARWFSERVRDVSEILAADGRTPVPGAPLPVTVAYDPPCHLLHGQGVRNPPMELLRAIPELELLSVPNGDECCGGAGIYGITHPELGGRIGGDKVAAVTSTGAELLATGNPGCAMQIGAGLRLAGSPMRVAHPVELLDESYRRAGFYDAAG